MTRRGRIGVGDSPTVLLLERIGLTDATVQAKPHWDGQGRSRIGAAMIDSSAARVVFIHIGGEGEAWLAVLRRFWRRTSPVLLHIGLPLIRHLDPPSRKPDGYGHCSIPLPNVLRMLEFLSRSEAYRESDADRQAVFSRLGWRYELKAKDELLHKTGAKGDIGFKLLTSLSLNCASFDELIRMVQADRGDASRSALTMLRTIQRRWFHPKSRTPIALN